MLSYSADSPAPPERAWSLMARPARWHEWAPHIRGATGLGSPEVEQGRSGVVWIAGIAPVPTRIVGKEPDRSWTWTVGPVRIHHRVDPRRSGGCTVGVDLAAPPPIEAALRVTYGPLVGLLVRNLARRAGRCGTA